jgi:hypothetical protein
MVTGTTKTCDGGLKALGGPSVCIDKCFNRALGLAGDIGALAQDACGSTEFCVP